MSINTTRQRNVLAVKWSSGSGIDFSPMGTLVHDRRNFESVGPVANRRQGADRRREIRMVSRGAPASLCVGARMPMEVEIKDVSRNGLGIIAPSPVLAGSSVVVICGGLTISGTVRHCKERMTGDYAAGVSITKIVDTGAGREI